MSSVSHFKKLIKEAIAELDLDHQPAEVYEPIKYILSLGGKRMRPVLVLLGNHLFKGKAEDAIAPALAIELFHNFTLVHDDIMDKAPIRRGKPTVHEKWNRDVAILSGDTMMIKTYELLVNANPEKLVDILKIYNRTAIQICEGQQEDMNFESRDDVSISEYLKMIEKKTAVLLGCSLEVGAITAGAPETECKKLYAFGKNIGMAFQLMDDLLDAYAEKEKFGKQPGGDIIADKKTYLTLKAQELAQGETKSDLQTLMSNAAVDNGEKVNSVINIYDQLNVEELTRDKAQEYYQIAKQNLADLNADEDRKKELLGFAEALMGRIS